jgi:acetyl esterase/lipase
MQNPEAVAQVDGIPRFMRGYIERQRVLYAVDREDTQIAGVHAYVYTPKGGAAATRRVLINLHGGGFSGCWPACAELESIPIAALAKIQVVSLDYRQGPTYKFPAASEDVAAVYATLLKDKADRSPGLHFWIPSVGTSPFWR